MRTSVIVALIFFSASLFCIPFSSVDIIGGVLWIGNGERPDETTGAPSPIDQEIGVSMPLQLSPYFVIDPGIYYYGLEYGYDEGPRPRPVQIENREMYVMNWIADVSLLAPFNITDVLTISPGVSVSSVFRIPLITAPGEEDSSSEMNSYFYGNTRYFFPGVCVKLNWRFSKKFGFIAKAGTRLPVFHLWDGESVPFYDQMHAYLDLGFSYSFNAPEPPAEIAE